jgi:hypothetical protein
LKDRRTFAPGRSILSSDRTLAVVVAIKRGVIDI